MAEPAKKLDDQDTGRQLSAMERARQSWGLPNANTDEVTADDQESPVDDERSALDRARDRWGEADIHNETGGTGTDSRREDGDSSWKTDVRASQKEKKSISIASLRKLATNKKNMAFGGIGAGIVSLAIMAIIALPGFVITNLREIILNRVSGLQTSQALKYRRTKLSRMSDLFSADGRRGGKIIAEMEKDGYKFSYGPNRRIVGITPPKANGSLIGDAMGEHISDYMEVKHPLRTSRWKTKRMEAFYGRYGISRKAVVEATQEALDDPEKAVNKALAETNEGWDDDLRGQTVDGESEQDAENRAARNSAAGEVGEDILDMDDVEQAIKDGEYNRVAASEAAKALDELGEGAGANIAKRANEIAVGSFGTKVWGSLRGFFNPTDVLDKICTLKKRLGTALVAARSFRALSMLRYASAFITAGDSIRTGNANPKLVSQLFKRVTSADRNGNPIGASPGFAYALKGKFSKSKNDAFKGKYGVDGKPTGVWGAIQEKTNDFPLTDKSSCRVVQNPVFQVAAGVATTVVGFFTGGQSTAAQQGAITTARIATEQSVKTAIKKAMQKIFTRRVITNLALTAAVEIGFEGMMVMTQMYVEKTMKLNFTGAETGADLGNILVGGGGVANKQRGLQGGMVPATTQQYAKAEAEYTKWKQEEMSKQSLFARMFDIHNSDSLAFNMASTLALSLPSSTSSVAGVLQNVGSFIQGGVGFRGFTSFLADLFGGKAYAQTSDEATYDEYTTDNGITLATDFAGSPQVILREDIANIDPQENIEYLLSGLDGGPHIDPETKEPTSDLFKKHIENCVEAVDIISNIEFNNDPADPANDCLAQNKLTVRFKAHLAYLDMVDSVDAELFPNEIGTGSASTVTADAGTTTNTGASAQYIPDCSVNGGNAAIACTAIDQLLGIPYDRPRRAAPTTPDPVPFLDCSAFTGMALYRTFGTNLRGLASTYYLTNPNFERITDIRDIQPGDFIGKGDTPTGAGGSGHIALVVSYDKTSKSLVTAETDGKSNPSRVVTTKSLAIDGKGGSYTWAVRYIGEKNMPPGDTQ